MKSKLGENFSQFGIKHLFLAIVTFSISLAVYAWNSELGTGLLLAVGMFWSGLGLLSFADSLDSRPVDQRSRVSQGMGLVGGLMVVGSFFLGAFWMFILAVGVLAD